MILVSQVDSPFVRRVAVTLHHYGMPYTRNTMSVIGDAAEMARINPLGRVPSLILDNGEVLIDSNAIADHLRRRRVTRPTSFLRREKCGAVCSG
jgi:glutathione S-transferase